MAALVSETKAAVCAVAALCPKPEVRERKKASRGSTSGRGSFFSFFFQDSDATLMPLQRHQPGVAFDL